MIKNMARHCARKMANVIRATLLASAFCLAACTNGPPVKSLRTPTHAGTITLNAVTKYAVQAGLFGGVRWTYTAQPGVYTAEKEDNVGTYFRLQGQPVTVHMGDEKGITWHHAGGIWVPHDSTKSPRIYYFADGNSLARADDAGRSVGTTAGGPAGGVVGGITADAFQAIANSIEAGKISIAPEPADATFASAVRAAFHSSAQ